MPRCVIVGGAKIQNFALIRSFLREDDYFIFCDCGLKHCDNLGVEPSLIVGDFDSFTCPQTDTETIVLPCEKDDTDTVFAVKEAIKRGFTDFLLIGAVGQRFDHTFGNISLLLYLDNHSCTAQLLDDYSQMEILSSGTHFIDDAYKYFSLLALGSDAVGVNIKNAKFPLNNATITCDYQYGISNEVLPGKRAEVSVREGRMLLVKIF